MTADAPTILATSAYFERGRHGAYDMRPGRIHHFAAELANAGDEVKICVLTGAMGDPQALIGAHYAAFARTRFQMSHLQVFPMPNYDDVRAHLEPLRPVRSAIGSDEVAALQCAVLHAIGGNRRSGAHVEE